MNLLNEKRFAEVKLLFEKENLPLSEREIKIYSNVFEIISIYIHNKLTNEEILHAYDFLSDVMLNNRPDIAYVAKVDRIRVAVALMETIPETKGKLTEDEKLAFAYCIFTGACTQVYDEERDIMLNGIVLFDSFEHINTEFEFEKVEFPDRFRIDRLDS